MIVCVVPVRHALFSSAVFYFFYFSLKHIITTSTADVDASSVRGRLITRALLLPDCAAGQLHTPEPAALEALLSCIACARALSPADNDPNAIAADSTLEDIGRHAPRQVCQYVFKRNDIVWICRTCQADETCVMCNDCFRDSKHKDHDVYFYHAQAGGCCDCGDADAWDPAGFCSKHGTKANCQLDPLAGTPPELVQQCSLVLDECVRAILLSSAEAVGAHALLSRSSSDRLSNAFDVENRDLHADYERTRSARESFDALRRRALNESEPNFIETPTPNDHETVSLVLHHDDLHTLEEVSRKFLNQLQDLGLGNSECRALVLEAYESGEATVWKGLWKRSRQLAKNLRSRGVPVSVRSERATAWIETARVAIRWLHRLARSSDALCRLVCDRFDLGALCALLRADARLPKLTALALHALYLTLMADQPFKRVIATAYASVYSQITADYGRGVGVAEHSLYTLSVQFLNRATFVETLVQKHSLLETLAIALYRALDSAATDNFCDDSNRRLGDIAIGASKTGLNSYLSRSAQAQDYIAIAADRRIVSMTHIVLAYRRYSPIIADLKCVLNIDGMAERFIARCLWPWLSTLSRVHGIDAQTRHGDPGLGHRDWMFAFNVNISVSSVFEFMAAWVRRAWNSSSDDGLGHDAKIELVQLLCVTVLEILVGRLPAKGTDVDCAHAIMKGRLFLGNPTFHIPLHRFLAHLVGEVVKSIELESVLVTLLDKISLLPPLALMSMIDEPVCTLRLAAQIRVGLWRRNEDAMKDQLMNYVEPPFCKMFRDLDLLIVQFIGVKLGAALLVRQLLIRFDVGSPLLGESVPSTGHERAIVHREDGLTQREASVHSIGLAEEALYLLIVLATELPRLPDMDELRNDQSSKAATKRLSGVDLGAPGASKSVRIAMNVRRELIHRLAAGPCTHSEVHDCFQLIPKSDSLPAALLENILDSVSVKCPPKGFEPGKLQLRPECWSEFDATFYHLSPQAHQCASESMPKLPADAIVPVVGPPPLVHPAFAQFRADLLTCDATKRALHAALREAMAAKELHLRAASNDLKTAPGRKPWTSDALVSRAIHLLTLAAHVASPAQLVAVLRYSPQELDCQHSVASLIARIHATASMRLEQRIRSGICWLSHQAQVLGLECALTPAKGTIVETAAGMIDRSSTSCKGEESSTVKTKFQERKRRARERALANMKRKIDAFATALDTTVPDSADKGGDTNGTQAEGECSTDKVQAAGIASHGSVILGNRTSTSRSLILPMNTEVDDKEDESGSRDLDNHASTTSEDSAKPLPVPQRPPLEMPRDDVECIICRDVGSPARPLGYVAYTQRSRVFASPSCRSADEPDSYAHGFELYFDKAKKKATGASMVQSDRPRQSEVAVLERTTSALTRKSSRRTRLHRRKRTSASRQSYDCACSLNVRQCGHALHYDCFDDYFVTVVQQLEATVDAVLDVSAGEFRCPLCKALSNTIVPAIWHCGKVRPLEPQRPRPFASAFESHESSERNADGIIPQDLTVGRIPALECGPYLGTPTSLGGVSHASTDKSRTDGISTIHDAVETAEGNTTKKVPSRLRPDPGRSAHLEITAAETADAAELAQWAYYTLGEIISNGIGPHSADAPPKSPYPVIHQTPLEAAVQRFFSCMHDIKRDNAVAAGYGANIARFDAVTNALASTISAVSAEYGRNEKDTRQFVREISHCGRLARVLCFALSTGSYEEIRLALRAAFLATPAGPDGHSDSVAVHKDNIGVNRPNIMKPLLRNNLFATLAVVVAMATVDSQLYGALIMFIRLFALATAVQRVYLDHGPPHGIPKNELIPVLRSMAFGMAGTDLRRDPNQQLRIDVEGAVRSFLWRAAILLETCGLRHVTTFSGTDATHTAWQRRQPYCGQPPGPDDSLDSWCFYFGIPPLNAMITNEQLQAIIVRWAAHAELDWHVSTDLFITSRPELIALPKAYTELHAELTAQIVSEHPAVCLVCGHVLCAGGKGICTRHAASCGDGTGVFFLLQECSLLFIHGPRACYFASPYVDAYGERHGQFRGRPLFLDPARFEVVRRLWATHSIADQVVQSRSNSRYAAIKRRTDTIACFAGTSSSADTTKHPARPGSEATAAPRCPRI